MEADQGARRAIDDTESLFLEVMLLMVAADGEVRDVEISALAQSVARHKVFGGHKVEDVADAFARAFQALARDGFDVRLEAIAKGLSDYRSQLLAFALATRICFADGTLAEEELALLKTFQIAFGLQDDHVAQVMEAVGRERDIETLIDSLLEEHARFTRELAHIEVMLLMAAADGTVQPEEAAQLALTIAMQPGLRDLSEEEVTDALNASLSRIRNDGIPTRLSALRRALPDESDRLRAIVNAYNILVADGVVAPGETQCLERMRTAFELSEAAMSRALEKALT